MCTCFSQPPGSGGAAIWGGITGTLADQTDLQAALDAKAALASPAFTGNPTVPTQAPGNNTTRAANTAFVTAAVAAVGGSAWGGITGTLSDQTDLQTALNAKATYASPNFSGVPTVPTAVAGTNTGQAASCAFVLSQILVSGGQTPWVSDIDAATFGLNSVGSIKFSGLTSSFPMLKRSAAQLHVKLADDSNFAALRAQAITGFSLDVTSGQITFSGSGSKLTDASQGVDFVELDATGQLILRGVSGGVNILKIMPPFVRFVGESSSFPALKRSGTILQVRTADDVDYADLSAAVIYADQAVKWGFTSASPLLKKSGADLQVRLADDSDFSGIQSALVTNAQTGTTYTLQASDNGKRITLSNASGITVTVPTGLGANFNCVCEQIGAGQVTFTVSGVTLNNRQGHTKIAGQWGVASIMAHTTTVLVLAGDTAA